MTTKEKILNTALKSFLTIGVDQTSLSLIADDIGIKKPSIYYHYKSKEEIVTQCVLNLLDDLEHRLELSLAGVDHPRMQIEAIYECIIDFHEGLSLMACGSHRQHVNFTSFLHRAALENESNRQRIEMFYQHLQMQFVQLLSSGQKQGLIKNALNKDIVSIDLISRIDGMITLSSLYKSANISTQRLALYESVWMSLQSEQPARKRKMLGYKSIDLVRKW